MNKEDWMCMEVLGVALFYARRKLDLERVCRWAHDVGYVHGAERAVKLLERLCADTQKEIDEE